MSKSNEKPLVNVNVKLAFAKQTKHTVVYKSDAEDAHVSSLYVSKDAFPTGFIPAEVVLVLSAPDDAKSAGHVEMPEPAEADAA